MCEACAVKSGGWRGWIELPEGDAGRPAGDWIDLSHPVSKRMPCASIFPVPSFRRLRSIPEHPFNVTEMRMVVHAGTHVDAPRHYYEDGPDAADIPLDRLRGPGVVWHVEKPLDGIIGVADLERCRPLVREGDIVALDTGWAARFGTPDYERHPSLSPEAAEWLAARSIKMLACDFATPDLVYHLRQPGFDWPVHRTLLSRGILVCQHLTGHAGLAGQRAEFIFGALAITGSDGAPARVIARRVEA